VTGIAIRALDLTDPLLLTRVVAVNGAGYRLEADLLGVPRERFPPARETAEDLLGSGQEFLGAFSGDTLTGVLSHERADDGALDVCRLVVDPGFHRRGIGRALVGAAIAAAGRRALTVSTGAANVPARTLYEQLGFRLVRTSQVIGIPLVHYRRAGLSGHHRADR
jgi:ribosomal protein S18 acetylase RimI-like enzyme